MTHWKESNCHFPQDVYGQRLTQNALTPPWPLTFNLKPVLNQTQWEPNKWIDSAWPVAAPRRLLQPVDGEPGERRRACYRQNVELSPRSTVHVAMISRFFPASAAQLGSGTQQFKVLAIWLTSAWSTQAAESRGQYTQQLLHQQFMVIIYITLTHFAFPSTNLHQGPIIPW